MADPETIRAAGGAVWRPAEPGGAGIEVLLVHRPRYDDWSLPKGKRDPGETDEACALREVEEETGLRCTLEAELVGTAYHDRHGRPKEVRYWAMHADAGSFTPGDEVDEVRWTGIDDAAAILSYDREAAVLDSLRIMAATA